MSELVIDLQNNRFSSAYECNFNGLHVNGDIVVDTGCTFTSIALNSSMLPEKDISLLKQLDITGYKLNGIPKVSRGIGVNDRDVVYKDVTKMSYNELFDDKTVGFIHKVDNFMVGGFNFSSVLVRIVYDRPGHSLLGMNILRLYESKITNRNGITEFILNDENQIRRGLVERCKFKIMSLFSKSMSVGDMRKTLSSEYSEECLDRAFCEIFEEHRIVNYKDENGRIIDL